MFDPRIAELVNRFREIGEDMRDLPFYNAALEIEAVDFQRYGDHWIGVLITPWFMNVIVLPHEKVAMDANAIGKKSQQALPSETHTFLCGGDEIIGSYDGLSLHSPMDKFHCQQSARVEAQQRLTALMAPPAEESPTSTSAAPEETTANLNRRALLFGRGSAG